MPLYRAIMQAIATIYKENGDLIETSQLLVSVARSVPESSPEQVLKMLREMAEHDHRVALIPSSASPDFM